MAPAIAAYDTENPRHFIGVYYRRHCLNLILLMVTLTYILSCSSRPADASYARPMHATISVSDGEHVRRVIAVVHPVPPQEPTR